MQPDVCRRLHILISFLASNNIPSPQTIEMTLNQSKPSIRLKQISRLISRQKSEDEESAAVTSTCLSIVIILILIFITGVAMLTSGAVVFPTCQTWLPTWLLVEGSSLLVVCLVMFCGHSQTGVLSLLARIIFVLLILVNIWCSIGRSQQSNE